MNKQISFYGTNVSPRATMLENNNQTSGQLKIEDQSSNKKNMDNIMALSNYSGGATIPSMSNLISFN